MIMRHFFISLWSLFFYASLFGDVWSASLALSGSLEQGSAVLLRVKDVIPGSHLTGTLNGTTIPFSSENVALLALDMEGQTGKMTLRVQVDPPRGKSETLVHPFSVAARKYPEEQVTLPKGKVELNKKDLKRAEKETSKIIATYKRRSKKTGYGEGFQQPVQGRFSGVFGSRRILNGVPRKPHNGVDIAAPKGTDVTTTAAGEVVLVGTNYFFTGNTLVIDHGDGVISLYAHLDTIQVRQGEWLAPGTKIGTVGMTGRATGPHLHWGVLVRHARVDPMLLPGIRPPL